MKKNVRNRVLLAVCAVLLACVSVSATLAYLTATTNTVRNTFTVGKVNFLSNGLDEADVNEYGDLVNDDGKTEAEVKAEDPDATFTAAARVTENEYKLIPGHKYTKDPTIHLDPNSEDCYLFVAVRNEIYDIEKDYGNTGAALTTTIFSQMFAKGWYPLNDATVMIDNLEYNLFFKGTDAGEITAVNCATESEQDVFESFTIAADANLNDYAGKKVYIKAYAVQADGLEGKTALEIWNATFGATN